mmetsp:Transcript_15307/g.38933  ORF Transcript_15307/g.38933 Transcript_15307/m.38933 type:complete len:244 (-) Transcript_15307:341-1072(-)
MTPETRDGIKRFAAIVTDKVSLGIFLRRPCVTVPEPRAARRAKSLRAVWSRRLAPRLLMGHLAPSTPPEPSVAKPLVPADADQRIKLLRAQRTHILAFGVLQRRGNVPVPEPAAAARAQRLRTVGPVELPPRCLLSAGTPLAPPASPIAAPFVASQPPDALELLVAKLAHIEPLRVLNGRMRVPIPKPAATSAAEGARAIGARAPPPRLRQRHLAPLTPPIGGSLLQRNLSPVLLLQLLDCLM